MIKFFDITRHKRIIIVFQESEQDVLLIEGLLYGALNLAKSMVEWWEIGTCKRHSNDQVN